MNEHSNKLTLTKLLKEGEECYYLGQYEKGISLLSQVIKIDPSYAEAYYWRGKCFDWKEEYDLALVDFFTAVEFNPSYADAYCDLGSLLMQYNDYDSAIENLSSAIRLESTNTCFLSSRASAFAVLGRFEDALADYNKAIDLDPDDPINYQNRGKMRFNQQEYLIAVNDFTTAIKIVESSSKDEKEKSYLYADRAEAYEEAEQFQQAIADYILILSIDPKNVNSLTRIGLIYQTLEDYQTALSIFTQALSLEEDSAFLLRLRGNTYVELDEEILAFSDFNTAIAIEPSSPLYYDRAEAFYIFENYANALDDLDSALELPVTKKLLGYIEEARNTCLKEMGIN
ncbi:MAG: hypothetical protein COA78_04720 [Blastopirellula sp.]|nr:MAG: hypothetical protein COA78_04720 [Blastopirellula sp.]